MSGALAPHAQLDHALAVKISELVLAAQDPPLTAAGEPGKFTPDVLQRIIAALRMGHTVNDACVFAGLAVKTYQGWLRRGQNGEEPYRLLTEVIDRLNVQSYSEAVECFKKGAKDDPKVAERFLARRAKQEWGTKDDNGSGAQVTVMFGLDLRGHGD